jgi:excisionase family DNA binding protein
MNHAATAKGALKLADLIEQRPRALLVSEVAALLGVSGRQIYKLAAENRISHLRIAGSIRFDPRHLAEWLRRHGVHAKYEAASLSFKNEARP